MLKSPLDVGQGALQELARGPGGGNAGGSRRAGEGGRGMGAEEGKPPGAALGSGGAEGDGEKVTQLLCFAGETTAHLRQEVAPEPGIWGRARTGSGLRPDSR